MARKFLVSIDLTKNELQNAVIQNLATAPSTPSAGQIYYNTNDNELYFYNGTAWESTQAESEVLYGTFAARPAAGTAGRLYYATDQALLYFDDGATWAQVSAFGSVTAQTSYGASSGNGSSNSYARTDHTHGTPSLTNNAGSNLSVGGTAAVGTGTAPARDDHTHGMPSFGSVTAQTTFSAASSDGSATTIARADHTHGTPAHDNAAHSAINLSALAVPTADVSFASYKITNLASPVASTDAANKQYVDDVAQGLNIHAASYAATTTNLNATYSNGTAGVGATLTNAGTQAAFSTDGVSPAVNARILVKNQTNTFENGIYTLTTVGSGSTNWVLTRATDFDTAAEIAGGDFTFVDFGSTLANTGWVNVDEVNTVGTDAIVFQQFSGAGTYTASNGVLLTGNNFTGVVEASGGLSVGASGFALDTTIAVRKYAANVGDGTATSYTVTHSLNTRDVIVSVYDNSSPYAEVVCDVQHTSTSAITLLFSVAPTSNQYRVVVHAQEASVGLLDRLARALAQEIQKAPNLPAGTVTMTEQEMVNRSRPMNQTYGQSVGLPRNPIWPNVPFTPGNPIVPGAINPLREDGRPDPRRYEYQVAQNINITETRLVPFKTLRATADQVDIIRRCLEVIKSKVGGMDWDIVLSDDASERIASESGGDHVRAMAKARERFNDDIARLRAFWESPDRANGYTFSDWINLSLEEILVVDAWAIWPQRSVGGDLYGFQVLDGSTIKPLIDDRGMRPMPPNPAFQQILYGFPRSEFMAPAEMEDADGEFTSDELSYLVKNRRSWTIYGFSPTERSLPLADIYLRRQQWIRAEYTDGVLPELMFKTDATFGANPELLRAYENIFNDDLAGQTAQRKRSRLLPAGMEPVQFDGYGEKFKDVLDNYLVTSICGHFGVLPSEIGFSGSGSLGASGLQQGETISGETIGIAPLVDWISKQLTNLSYVYLGMPRELEFRIMFESKIDTEAEARRIDIELKNGNRTVNEARSMSGLPLLDTPQADMPMLHSSSGLFFLSPEGIIDAATAAGASALEDPDAEAVNSELTIGQKPQTEENELSEELVEEKKEEESDKAAQEVKKFLKWLRKGNRTRPFNFEVIESDYAEIINKYIAIGDGESARWYAERYLGL